MLNGLLVADVGVDSLEAGQFRTGLGRDVEPALRHDHQQADRFERNGLAARVWTGDDQRKCPGDGVDRDRYHRSRVDKWVPCIDQFNRGNIGTHLPWLIVAGGVCFPGLHLPSFNIRHFKQDGF